MDRLKALLFRPERMVFLLALTLRLLFFHQFSSSPFFAPIAGGNDRSLYVAIAERVAAGHIVPEGVFQYMPLYGWFLGFIFAVGKEAALLCAGLTGCVLDAFTAALIVRCALSLGAPAVAALVSGVLYAFYPVAIVYSVLTMPNTLNAFLLLLVAKGIGRLDATSSAWRWLMTGLLAGVACLGFAGMLLIVFVCFIFFAVRRQFRGAVLLLLGAALPIIPISIHNTREEREFVLITAHGGFNFYMGNHEGATGYPMQIAGFRGDAGSLLVDARRQAEQATGRNLSGKEFSKYWSDQAWQFVQEKPGAAVKLFGLKMLRLVNFREYDDMRMLPMMRLAETGLRWPTWPGFAPIAILGLFGLFVARGCVSLKLITGTGMLALAAFFITSRYRLTFAPLLCILGAVAFKDWTSVARALPALLVATVVVALPLPQTDFRALDHYNAAAHLVERGRVDEALSVADEGLKIDTNQADLHFVRGNALFGLNRLSDAAAAYREAIKSEASHAQAHFNLAVVLKNMGDLEGARQEAEIAVKFDPDFQMAKDFLTTQ